VFTVNELVENILPFLQPNEIISCRRLSTTIKNTIDASCLLKERMFLQITCVPQQSWRVADKINGHGKGITNTRPVFGIRPAPYFLPGNFEYSILPDRTRTVATLNPTFPPSELFRTREYDPDADHKGHDCDSSTLAADGPLLKYAHVQGCTPSLLGMYLINPPCLNAWFYFQVLRLPSRFTRVEFTGRLQKATGITIGDLLNFASVVRGVGIFVRTRPPELPEERWAQPSCSFARRSERVVDGFDDVTMFEFLDLLNTDDQEDRVELYGELRCEFLDTIIPTDRMRAGVAPYVETGGEPKYSPDEDWTADDPEEEADDEADEEEEAGEEGDEDGAEEGAEEGGEEAGGEADEADEADADEEQ
jgi:hypothetical protein